MLAFVEADRETRTRRGIERDGDVALPYWQAWMEREAVHFEVNQTRAHADLVSRTDEPA